MNINRKLTIGGTNGQHVRDIIKWKTVEAIIDFKTGETTKIEVPEAWSDTAANILASKYLRKAGVSQELGPYFKDESDRNTMPQWLRPSLAVGFKKDGGETSAHQVFHRLAGHWTYTGWKHGYFEKKLPEGHGPNTRDLMQAESSAQAFYDEIYIMLALQMAAPNSPQFFNCGLWWAYGIEGDDTGSWRIEGDSVVPTTNSYEYPQLHACFINKLDDNLVDEGGIFDLLAREAREFKFGSGAGTNFSVLRGKGEKLAGGGTSSGLMPFLSIFDRAAGAIQSGGTTRRAAKMVCVDIDHPEIEDFITLKSREQRKIKALRLGSEMLGDSGPIYGDGWEEEATRSVDGQNANYSVRITDKFLKDVDNDEAWDLWPRRAKLDGAGSPTKTLQSKELWILICKSAWESADPGVQFHDTINRWHTCKTDGQINASNPCSEYMFLDDTGCNLASLNLARFFDEKNNFKIELFEHAVRLWTMVLDISVQMGSYPSKSIAENTRKYRTLGLGYANAGGILIRLGIPYDSDEGRALIYSITALLQGFAYRTSAEMAVELGSFPHFDVNKSSMLEVISMHTEATCDEKHLHLWDKLRLKYYSINDKMCDLWSKMPKDGFRNAQVSVIAPTGTISLVMDCETSGIEPELALRKGKKLAGGGSMSLGNAAIEPGLIVLGYKPHERNLIMTYISQHSTVEGCPDIKPEHLSVFDCANAPDGFSRCLRPEAHILMMAAAQPFISGAISKTVNLPSSATVKDFDRIYRLAHQLGLKSVAAYRDQSKTAQPLSAGTKTPNEIRKELGLAPIEGTELYEAIKTIAQTSDASRLLDLEREKKNAESREWFKNREEERETKTFEYPITGSHPYTKPKPPFPPILKGHREPLPFRVEGGYRQKVRINGETLYHQTRNYPDGRLGEIWISHSREGSTARAYLEGFAKSISIGLQYGVPLEEYVGAFLHTRFEPSGFVENHERIKQTSSIFDYLVRDLAIHYLGRDDLGEVKPEEGFAMPEPIHEESLQEILKEMATRFDAEIVPDREGIRMVPRRESSGRLCGKCGHTMSQTGSCYTCPNCGENTGCG